MRITQLVKGSIGAAAVAMLLAPTAAQAQPYTDPGNYSFLHCPSCTTAGNAWQGMTADNDYTYLFSVAQSGMYAFSATGTAGDLFRFYYSTDSSLYWGAATLLGTYERPSGNPIGPAGSAYFEAGVQYYLSATADCTSASTACNTTLHPGSLIDPGQTVVPEPMTVILLGSGLVGIAGLRRRRRAQELETGV